MLQKQKDNIIIRLLLESRFRVLRHLILFLFVLFISAGLIWYVDEENMISLNKYIGLFFYVSVLLGSIYFNIYVLVPRLLLKSRWLGYFSSLLGLVFIVLFLVVLAQDFFYEDENLPFQEIDYFIGIMSILSNVISFIIFFAGTTAFVLFRNWIRDLHRANELESATLHSELKLLENQINPHFLFNMLNNANIMIHEEPDVAADIILKLEDMLRYQMNDGTADKVFLCADINFLTDFLELEKTRRDCFEYSIVHEGNMEEVQVPRLLFIPFVENAIKHNLDSEAPSFVHILFKVQGERLIFVCENSVPLKPVAKKGGLGLVNIKRRLDLLYGNDYTLDQMKAETTYRVTLELKRE